MRRAYRWTAVLVGLAVLVALPTLVALRPLHARPASAASLLADVQRSRDTGYSALVQTEGDLSLPNLPGSGTLASLLSSSTRLRVWYAGATRQRVDELSNEGEDDTITDGAVMTSWDSSRDEVTTTVGSEPLRVPQAGDLLPAALAQRLTPTGLAATLSRLPAVRIAGRTALGLRITPTDQATTIAAVDIDVDQATGLPLRIAVTAHGQSQPSFTSTTLELTLGRPAASLTSFVVPPGATVRHTQAPDFVADTARYAPFQLPAQLAGLSRTQRISTLGADAGAGTYGSGYALLALLPLQRSTAERAISALRPPVGTTVTTDDPDATAVEERLPVANVLVVETGNRAYLLTGTVTTPVLLAAANQLIAAPPPYRPFTRRPSPPRTPAQSASPAPAPSSVSAAGATS